jgi:hypothetical protein
MTWTLRPCWAPRRRPIHVGESDLRRILNPDEVRSWKFFGAERPACLVFTLVVRRRRWIGREVSCDVVGDLAWAARLRATSGSGRPLRAKRRRRVAFWSFFDRNRVKRNVGMCTRSWGMAEAHDLLDQTEWKGSSALERNGGWSNSVMGCIRYGLLTCIDKWLWDLRWFLVRFKMFLLQPSQVSQVHGIAPMSLILIYTKQFHLFITNHVTIS